MDVTKYYRNINEDARFQTRAADVEYQTTCRYIERYLKKDAHILEIGAAYGAYSLRYASMGYHVTAIDLMEHHVIGMQKKITADMDLHCESGNALDLSRYDDNSFDMVLCLGPLYHLQSEEEKLHCIKEAKRVCRKDGIMIFAYISNDMCMMSEQFTGEGMPFSNGSYNQETFQLQDDVFAFLSVKQARELMKACDLTCIAEVAADGLSELLRDKINMMDDAAYERYLRYHFHICEKPELLGYSNHILYIGQK